MKKIALVSTYCDTQEKIEVLEKNIHNLKVCGLDVMVISPLDLPNHIQKKCDFYYFTKENPVLDWPLRATVFWKTLFLGESEIRITTTVKDYGWAGLYQVKKLSEFALTYDYEYFYHLIYDLTFDETVVEGLLSERKCSVYPSQRDNTIWKVGLHFMIFDRENLQKFISHINLESYLANPHSDAFVWLHRTREIFDYDIMETPVKDEVFYYDNKDLFNSSPIKDLKIFIEKNDEKDTTVKLLFYDLTKTENIILRINEKKYEIQLNGNSLIDLGFKKKIIEPVWIEYENVNYELTEIIEKIKHNTLKKL